MKDEKSFGKRKIILLVVFILAGLYSYYLWDSNAKLNSEKLVLIDNLIKSRDSISNVIVENSSIKDELLVEQQKIINLIDKLKESEITISELSKYKEEVVKLRKQVSLLKSDKMVLVKKYETLKNEQDSTLAILKKLANEYLATGDTLVKEPNENSKITKSKEVIFANLKVETFLANNTLTKMEITDKSEEVNYCRITFLIRGNEQTIDKKGRYFVQIIDPSSDVIGYRLSYGFGRVFLDYSYGGFYSFNGENKEEISGIFLKKLKKGTYSVSLYKDEKIALKSEFSLK